MHPYFSFTLHTSIRFLLKDRIKKHYLKDRHNSMLNSRKIHSLLLFTIIYNTFALDNKIPLSSSLPELPTQQLDLTLPSTDSKKQKSRMRKSHNKNKRKIHTYR